MGEISLQLLLAREIIARLDEAQDFRPLSAVEMWLRCKLKHAYLGLASLERSLSRQRSRFSWLRVGAANSAFCRIHASQRLQKKRIHALQVGDQSFTDEAAMAQAAFEHFSGSLGSADSRAFSLNFPAFEPRSLDLSALELPFSADEIWHAIKLLPTGKAPGPDGFTAQFLRFAWVIIRDDIVKAFGKLYELNGQSFQRLNEALLTLLPKRPDAASLSDYRPIA
ncbi:uncharacterized protein [Aegilops tauschii subsp. strangulata]|uniref:uncharacterized protein n=1 Tax=Aegilops tauschii subsp. strangulata TaxID=200361 RepID=UPI003CC8D0C8